ncbi:O-mannosyl-transferase 2-like 3 [Homarus americanus]|uniref:Protein O-mannosyl-transferase 2 n=1 Tax=Homarus americanus TaxID=6706 RepID=A0A8J5JIU7_HOMAM|nr:O-mannosyl-transferase 2-like 3 [Homarus americanus]
MSCKEQIHNIEENTTDETLIKKWKTNKRRWRLTSEERWWVCYITLTMLALTTRQASLDQPSGTLWDEVHFGTFANHYINRTFYHDVHPPLGKMVIAGAAWLSGYNGSFEFTQGKRYTPDINYVAMRSGVGMGVVGVVVSHGRLSGHGDECQVRGRVYCGIRRLPHGLSTMLPRRGPPHPSGRPRWYVQYGANLTIQSSRPICGFLESWFDLFPSEWTAPCQQVTTSTLRDHEALSWIIKKVDLDAGAVIDGKDPQQEVVLDGAGGPFETWQLLIPGEEVGVPLTTISHDFLLKHYKMNCYLKANEKVKLPPWAFKGAKEVTCTKNREQPGIEWHINWNVSPMVNKTISVRDKTVGLWGKIFFQHLNMFIGNAVLITGDDNDRNARPWMWPTNWQIQLLGSFPENKTAEGGGEDVYAVGMTNPLLTYLNLMGLGGVLVLSLAHSYCKSRCPHQDPALVEARGRTLVTCWWLLLCWAIHYLPFFFMSRVLYYHHYCPSYLFSCMITGVLLSWICETLSRKVRDDLREEFLGALLLVPVSALLASYIYFWPLATYMRGEIFEANPRLNPGLDFFYLGQLWPEFGYRKSEFQTISTTLVDRWLKDHLHNPDINATLYYTTPLDNTASHPSALQPVPASNYSLWTPGAVDPVGIL